MIGVFTLAELASSLGLTLRSGDARFTGVSTDSRRVNAGDLFVALSGETFDAHDFVAEAERRGAAALVCQRPVTAGIPVLYVDDCRIALGHIARLNRMRFAGPVVALTGSAGKTTTKEMISAILQTRGRVMATRGNLNNEIGVPLTLLRLTPEDHYAVIEMGAGKHGDIGYLGAWARPVVTLVTNVLPAHLQGFGTIEAVAATKGEIYGSLTEDGIAVLNLDEPFCDSWRATIGARRIVGVSALGKPAADVRARDVAVQDGFARFVLECAAGSMALSLRIPGVQQVANAAMAAAVGLALGVELTAIRDALQSLTPIAGRMAVTRTAHGCVLIDDTYNANPGSVRAAIDSLATFAGTRVLVLGQMAELGPQSQAFHREIGVHARTRGIDELLAVGEHAAATVEGFGPRGRCFAERAALAEACRSFDRAGVTMLVKGSRSAGMEAVVTALGVTTKNTAQSENH
jgi:UDP-N-acetylmuramoyl-tripeptide--D-alanyl-D-alanine ligase